MVTWMSPCCAYRWFEIDSCFWSLSLHRKILTVKPRHPTMHTRIGRRKFKQQKLKVRCIHYAVKCRSSQPKMFVRHSLTTFRRFALWFDIYEISVACGLVRRHVSGTAPFSDPEPVF